MRIALCIEKSNGFSFNNRRLSQDGAILYKLSELAGDGKICLNEYSSKLFLEKDNLKISENFFSEAEEKDICFVENSMIPELKKITEIYLFKWNRDYPADTYFLLDLKNNGFNKVKTENFAGTSHKQITLEIYRKETT